MVVAQTNAQVDDLVLRLHEKDPGLRVGRLHSSEGDAYDPALRELPSVTLSAKPGSSRSCRSPCPRRRSGRT